MATSTRTEHFEAHELSIPRPTPWEEAQPEQQQQQQRQADNTLGHDEQPETRLSPSTRLKIASASFSFFAAGVNDGSLGAIIPHVIREYSVSTAIVSSVYGATFAGWLAAAVTNTHLSQYLGLGSMMALGAACQMLAHVLRAWLPPFSLFVVTFFFAALGQAYNDTHANNYVAGVDGAHRWLAAIHASYMAGCLTGPFVATAIASAGARTTWYLFYLFPVGICLANLIIISWAFRGTLVIKPKPSSASAPDQAVTSDVQGSRNKEALGIMASTLATPSLWLLGMFYFFYIGSQLTANGWVVEYLVEVRGGDLSSMGYVPAGFNGGCLLGRLLLAEPTYRLGERRMVLVYCLLALGLQLVFWLVPNIIAASVAISFIGFFTGPLFATGMSVASKLFPHEMRATALVFVFVLAQLGGSFFPIVTGIVASRVGVASLQPILVGILAVTTASWLLVPRPKTLTNAALHQE